MMTGKSSPKSVLLCTTTASPDGGWFCNGLIPSSATAGAKGPHKIVATSSTTKRQATTTFKLK